MYYVSSVALGKGSNLRVPLLYSSARSQLVHIKDAVLLNVLGLVDYHVCHVPNAYMGIIDGKANVQKIKLYPSFRAKLIKFKKNLYYLQ